MMHVVTAAIVASTLVVNSLSHATEVGSGDNQYPGGEFTQRSTQSHMFNGVSSTEHQHQQIRDLMQQARHEQPPVNASELEAIHHLITVENFDKNAVRTQTGKAADKQIARQVEMAKVHNRMYRLLMPEQQAVLNEEHQQRMEQLRDVA